MKNDATTRTTGVLKLAISVDRNLAGIVTILTDMKAVIMGQHGGNVQNVDTHTKTKLKTRKGIKTMKTTVLLDSKTVIETHAPCSIGDMVQGMTVDENGCPVSRTGIVVEILEKREDWE